MSVGFGAAGHDSGGEASRLADKSDWSDQDLLTLDLATERLDEEIAELRRRIEDDDAADIEASRHRMALLVQMRDEMAKRAE